MRQKKLDENVNILPATDILCIKIFDTWIFFNQRTAPIWPFTALWDRFFCTENRVTAHLCIKKFGAPNLLIHWRFPHENFWHCETINSDKTVMPSYSARNFSVPGNFSEHRRVPLQIFLAMWIKKNSTENRDAVPLSSPSKTFLNTKKLLKGQRDPEWSFSVLWDKKFSKKAWYSLLCIKTFCIRFLSKYKSVTLPVFSVLWDTKKISRELWCHHPPPAPSSAW